MNNRETEILFKCSWSTGPLLWAWITFSDMQYLLSTGRWVVHQAHIWGYVAERKNT